MGLGFYVLTSHNLYCLKRHIEVSQIPLDQLTVVINTLDDNFRAAAETYCISEGISYEITLSDGSPSTGKNSVLELFLETDQTHAVLIDGDDYLLPHAIQWYNDRAAESPTVDAIALYNQHVIVPCDWDPDHKHMDPAVLPKNFVKYLTLDNGNWEYLTQGRHMDKFKAQIDHSFALRKQNVARAYQRIKAGTDRNECFLRVPFFSRKAAQTHFKDLYVGEDKVWYFDLKNRHALGEINMKVHDEETLGTYVYDMRVSSVVVSKEYFETMRGERAWQEELSFEINAMWDNGQIHELQLDDI